MNFSNEQSAFEFRNSALQSSWKEAKVKYETDSFFVSQSDETFNLGYKISPLELSRTIKVMLPGEISLVVKKEPALFTVVQLVKIIEKNTVPEFNFVKNEIEEMYYFGKRKELLSEYLNQLYSKYKVELKKVDE